MMKMPKLFAFLVWLALVPCHSLAQQEMPKSVGATVPASPPAHPITEATLRQYYEVCRFTLRNGQAMEAQLEKQQKALPAWYPAALWEDTVKSVLSLDVVSISLPVYQKYWSEEIGRNLIRLFVTPAGQEMIGKVYDGTVAREQAGDSALEAYRKTLAAERSAEDAKIHEMLNAMTPKEHQEMESFVRSDEWTKTQRLMPQIQQEISTAYLAAKSRAADEAVERHRSELMQAMKTYNASHPAQVDGAVTKDSGKDAAH